jgi:hypothetical protein
MNAQVKSGLQVLGGLAAATLGVSAVTGCSNNEILRFAPIELDGPINASIVQKKPESTGIEIKGAQILPAPLGITLAAQDAHGQDSAQQITAIFVPDNNNHIVVVKSDQPGYLNVRFENNCPNNFSNPKVSQNEGLAGILTQLEVDSEIAENVQTQLMVRQTNEGLAYRGSVIQGKDLTSALNKAPKSLVAEFAPDKKYIVHKYTVGCQDANGQSQQGVSETTYFLIVPNSLGRHH